MPHLKLMKLLYLSDRKAVREFGGVISGDRPVSMPHGPVLSMTLDLTNGNMRSKEEGWEYWIADKENHEVSLRKAYEETALDELSLVELEVLRSVWNDFGHMDQWTIRDWTHVNCSEWKDPSGSSLSISYGDLARGVGFSDEDALYIEEQIESEQRIDNIFARL